MSDKCIIIENKEVEPLKKYKESQYYSPDKRHVFIVGSKGIPAAYGGFETFVEKLTEYRSTPMIRYHVARMAKDYQRFLYNNAECFNIKVPNVGAAKAIYYDIAALHHSIKYCKAHPSLEKPIFYVLACRIGPFIRLFKRRIRKLGGVLYVNPDGHEWKRKKWSAPVRAYWKLSEKLMVKHADLLICDSKNIEKYIQEDYRKYRPQTTYISYGSDTTSSKLADDDKMLLDWYKSKGVAADRYYLMVGRFVPENNYETAIREFMSSDTDKDLVIISTQNGKLQDELESKLHYSHDLRIKFVGTVYDQELLKKIRENAYGYIHGHEVGGTNPSLLEALSFTKVNLLLGVGFNKEVGEESCLYWSKKQGSLKGLIHRADHLSPDKIREYDQMSTKRIEKYYNWSYIRDQYEKIFLK